MNKRILEYALAHAKRESLLCHIEGRDPAVFDSDIIAIEKEIKSYDDLAACLKGKDIIGLIEGK